ncbi:hypothetical protein U0070_022550, partial [Myodes glareolus]
ELSKCRLSETMCDVTIVVGSCSIPAHEAVLACAVGYFQNLLNTGLDAFQTYVVDFITPKMLSFIYTSELFTNLINVGVIYEVGKHLGMKDLLRACHSTFPDLESTARNYVLPTDAGGSYKKEERNVDSDANHSLHLPQLPVPPMTEDHDAPVLFTFGPTMVTQPALRTVSTGIRTSMSSCQSYKVQSNGDFNKSSFFASDSAIDITTGTNSCLSNSDPGFGQVCKKVLEPNIQLIWQHALDNVDLLTGNCKNNIIVHPNEPLSEKLGLFPGAASPELKCAACGKALGKDFHVVRGHILDHLNLKGQACSICDQCHLNLCSLMWHTLIWAFRFSPVDSFVDWHLLEKHMAVHQSLEDTLFRCHLCSQSFRSEAAYHYHVSQHKCTSGFDTRPSLGLQHLALQKRKLPAEEFLSCSTIKCHLKTHSGALMYHCTVCGCYSSTLNIMTKHVGMCKGSLLPDFTIEQTFMYIIHFKETEKNTDS